ncbi:hypothetical protein ACTFIW_009102 [Dictyostelium discoideum]
MSETQEFWLISAPNLPGADIFDQVNQKTAKENSLSENKKFNTPALRVGTLNSLITLNDELQKIDTIVESTTKKIARQLVDLVGTKPGKDKSLSINGHTIPQYLQQFAWDDAKYNLKLSLQEIVEKISSVLVDSNSSRISSNNNNSSSSNHHFIFFESLEDNLATVHQAVSKIDDDLKIKSSEYSTLSSSVASEERKASGNLQVRTLNDLITADNIVQTDYFTTAFVVIPKQSEKEFLACYETISDFVLGRSAKRVAQDNDYFLYSVILFKKFYENFKTKIIEKKWVVRDFKLEDNKPTQERSKLTEDKKNCRTSLIRWCRLNFPEAFMAWVHLKVVRVFVESVLRFGIPFNFQAILMKPQKGADKKVRDILFDQFKYLGSAHISGKNETDDSEKFYPYISVSVNWEN